MSRRARAVLLLAAAALAAGAAPAAAAVRLSGRVIDAETRRPVAGARVELSNAAGGAGFHRDRTSASGEFALAGIAADRAYTLAVRADGHADFVLGWWQLPGAQSAAEVVIPLDRSGSIAVRLTAGDGRTPVAGARIAAHPESPPARWSGQRDEPVESVTGADGRARFVDLRAGTWTLTAQAAGRVPAEARRVVVRRGEETAVTLPMPRPASLSGEVRLADGTPAADVTVLAQGPGENAGTSGPDGRFTVGDLRPGRYRLVVQHEGFEPAAARESFTLAEGQAREAGVLTLTPRPLDLAFVLPREVFGTRDRVELVLRSFRVGAVDLALHRVPVAALLDGRDFRRFAAGPDTAGLERVRSWTHLAGDGPPFSWREEMLRLEPGLPPGVYLLRALAGGLERRQLLFVSDLSLLVKRSASRLLVSAAALESGVPLADVAVSWLPARGAGPRRAPGTGWAEAFGPATAAGATGPDGVLSVPLAGTAAPVRVVAVSERHGVAVAESPLAPAAVRAGDRVHLYTERPIYRPGQTVFWKLFARREAGGGYVLPDASSVRLELSGPQGAAPPVAAARLGERGSADGAIELPRDLPLGEYRLQAAVGAATGTAAFAIEEYRKPEFQVEVAPEREVVVSGDEVTFRVAATYFFGAPVFGARVRYQLFESRLPRAADPGEEDFEPPPDAGYGRVLETGETRTDLDGRVVLAFTPDRVSYDRRLTLEVEVVDPANRRVRGRGSVIVGRGMFRLAVRPRNRLAAVGEPVVVEVTTRDHRGTPVAAAVTVALEQDAWNPIERRSTRATRPLATATVTTGADGRGQASLTPQPPRSGPLVIRARAEDARGNLITDEASVWVHDPRAWQHPYRYPSLEAIPDQERYRPGDSARVVVQTDAAHGVVLATLEGREIEDHRVVHLFGNTALISFPIRAAHAPNVYVAVHVRRGNEIVSRVLDLPVSGERRDLSIAIVPDRAEYRPGDPARVAIETRDAGGAPVAAEVSLAVVDEAIYALRPDRTPRAHDVFYGHRPNAVTTVAAFPAIHLGGAAKSERDEVRRDFRDVAFWAPTLLTGDDGRAAASFRFPDNLTTWRLTSRGATLDSRVGEAVASARVTRDLVARIAAPRLLVAGDRVRMATVVTNRSGLPQPRVEESFEAGGAAVVRGERRARSSIPPGGESRREWVVEAEGDLSRPAADTVLATLTFRAESPGDRDALEVPVPVRPRAVPTRSHGAFVVAGERHEATVRLPSDLVRPGSEVRVDLSPSPAAMALAATEALAAFPWACTEQTANVVRPAAALLAARGGGAAAPPGWEDPERRLAPFLARLVALQGPEGGWGWWEEAAADPDPYMTVLAVDALARAAERGLGGEPVRAAIQRSAYALQRATAAALTHDGQAYVLAHATGALPFLEGSGEPAAPPGGPGGRRAPPPGTPASELRLRLEDLGTLVHEARDRLSVAGLALGVRGLADLGRAAEARALLAPLLARAVSAEGLLHWPAAIDASGWFGEAEENTGYALSALLAVDPRDRRAEAAVRWLARRRTGRLWRSTRTTAPVAIALAEMLAARPGELRPELQVRVAWNGEELLEREVTTADVFAPPIAVRIPGRLLRPGDQRLTVEKRGPGSLSVAWEATAMVPSPGPASPDAPLTVRREYVRTERTTDRRGRPQFLAAAAPAAGMAVGDLVKVRLVLEARQPVDFVMIQDPRPAGFEVEALRPEGLDWPWDVHAEARDDRTAFFLTRLEAGETVIEYLVRPELAGRVTALPASAAAMYDPDWIQRGAETTIDVRGE